MRCETEIIRSLPHAASLHNIESSCYKFATLIYLGTKVISGPVWDRTPRLPQEYLTDRRMLSMAWLTTTTVLLARLEDCIFKLYMQFASTSVESVPSNAQIALSSRHCKRRNASANNFQQQTCTSLSVNRTFSHLCLILSVNHNSLFSFALVTTLY